LMDSVII